VNAIQEKIKQEKAKVTTKSLIAKKKTKTRVVDILPPKKKKDKKEEAAQLADLDHDLNVNGASVAETMTLDVERILSKYGGFFLVVVVVSLGAGCDSGCLHRGWRK